MIPISFSGNERETINTLYHKLLDVKVNQSNKKTYISNIREINLWCNKNIVLEGKSVSFPQIIQSDFCMLQKISEKLSSGIVFPQQYEDFIIKTLYQNRFPRKEFMESLGVTVCPYCNRNYVNSAKKRTMCDLDHFFNKDQYPLLAVSFYNLIPVCHSCNHAKSTQKVSYSPHDKRYRTDELLTFGFYLKGIDFLSNKSMIGIEINETDKIKGNVKELKLKELYQIHTDIVQDCIKKAIVFSPEYLRYIYNTYREIFESEDELYRTVFGNYIGEEAYGKRPLAKLTSDVIKDLFESFYGMDL